MNSDVTVEEFEEAITEIEADLSTVMAMVTQTNAMVQENTNLISDVYTGKCHITRPC